MHTPLHIVRLNTGMSVSTAGRIKVDEHVWIANAHTQIRLLGDWDVADGDLVRVHGEFGRDALRPDVIEVVGRTDPERAFSPESFTARAELLADLRRFFEGRDFLEVETPNWVGEPGTDVYLEPVRADFVHESQARSLFLHTSPEFAMKRLLVDGFERIFQVAKVYRNGEVGPQHNPEFTMLEWYRAWEPMDAIIDDVEALVSTVLGIDQRFERVTMQSLFLEATGIDILAASDAESLRRACRQQQVLDPAPDRRWDEIFFELLITAIDDELKRRGPVFVTHWPTSQAVLARRDEHDPRVALRFELYVDGIELANGFEELTDPHEQRMRFEEDIEARRAQGLNALPLPENFLGALERGMPPAAGVALGLDRLLMKKMGVDRIDEVAPFAWFRESGLTLEHV